MEQDAIVIRLTGDSGDGVQLVGEQLTITAALTGKAVQTLPDFPAEIRAPAGTVAGVSGFQLAMAEHAIFTAGEELDVLVALNPAALKQALSYLKSGGLLILNEDNMDEKDWEKAKSSAQLLQGASEYYQVLSLPLITNTLAALAELELTHAQAKKSKNFYVLGVVLWLFDLPLENSYAFITKKFQANEQIVKANSLALRAGYDYAMTLELARSRYIVGGLTRDAGEYRQLTGVEGVAMAVATMAATTGVQVLVSGYPITPSSAILQECAKLADFGVHLLQAEDEIAALCACLGAAFGGRLALTCTSGPGMSLKSEGLGLAVVSELPLVLVDVQRAGASTGLPTKTGQCDLQQALYGRHGEAPLPVFAAKSPADCFNTVLQAFTIAIKYMTPVIVLLDAYLANAAEPWQIPELADLHSTPIDFNRSALPFKRDDNLARSWNVPGTPGFIHQLGGLEKQGDAGSVSYDADNHQQMVNTRAQKVAGIAREYAPLIIDGNSTAEILLVGWGSTYGALKSAVNQCALDGLAIALLHIRELNPLPHDLREHLRAYAHILVAELNSGQFCQVLRAKYLVNARSITQCNGLPFTTSYLVSAIKAEMSHAKDCLSA